MTRTLLAAVLATCLAGCHRDMHDQPRYDALEPSPLFANGQSARPLPLGTVARGQLVEDEALETGRVQGQFVLQIPLPLDRALVERGQERFNIYCAPCHSRTGDGNGMIVRRGFRPAQSLHAERLRQAPAGHFFDVITHGFGAMPRYGYVIAPRDRWAIVAYIRALQASQQATLDEVPPAERSRLEAPQP